MALQMPGLKWVWHHQCHQCLLSATVTATFSSPILMQNSCMDALHLQSPTANQLCGALIISKSAVNSPCKGTPLNVQVLAILLNRLDRQAYRRYSTGFVRSCHLTFSTMTGVPCQEKRCPLTSTHLRTHISGSG